MNNAPPGAPVAFLIFNRPETTERVFAEIARARPPKLLVIADGPRADRAGEAERCRAARAIIERVDWDCEVLRNFSDTNLGCRARVSSGLDWVFGQVESAIVLEDDCLPHPDFFRFCEDLLERYRDDERIAHISGTNFLPRPYPNGESYHFSRYTHVWGWASWRRAWRNYDVTMSAWPRIRDDRWLDGMFGRSQQARYWRWLFENVYRKEIDTWDYQWLFANWTQNALSIVPSRNLVSNIGFGASATHTRRKSTLSGRDTADLAWPLQHPAHVMPDASSDAGIARMFFGKNALGRAIYDVRKAVLHRS